MSKSPRKRMTAIPNNWKKLLNPLQLMAIKNVEKFGWELHFVRRNGLDTPVPVVKGPEGELLGVIDLDGNINNNPNIIIRN